MNDTLSHYGVKGMKWGVLKTKKRSELSNSLKPVSKPEKSNGYDASHRVATDHVRAKYLTNEDLAARTKRLQLEKAYNDLRPKTATEKLINASFKIGTQVLTEVGKEYAKSYVSSFANSTIPKPGQSNGKGNTSSNMAKSNKTARNATVKDPSNAFRRK
jgi:hypothetical protein